MQRLYNKAACEIIIEEVTLYVYTYILSVDLRCGGI